MPARASQRGGAAARLAALRERPKDLEDDERRAVVHEGLSRDESRETDGRAALFEHGEGGDGVGRRRDRTEGHRLVEGELQRRGQR
eukprot:4349588-Prymnesium_polylepis.1